MKYSTKSNLIRRFVVVAFSFLIVGCATRPTPIDRDTAMRIHRVSVISLTAKEFTRQYTGLTIFGNEKDKLDISDWIVDEQYEAQLAAELEKFPGITVVKAPYSVVEFSHVNNFNILRWRRLSPNWNAIEDATKNYCSRNSLDGVLVLASRTSNDFLAQTNQFLAGVGIYATHRLQRRVSVMHLISEMALFDCRTAKPIAVRILANNQTGLPDAIVNSAPILIISQDISRRPIAQWSEEQMQQVHTQLLALPGNAWSSTLKSIFPDKSSE